MFRIQSLMTVVAGAAALAGVAYLVDADVEVPGQTIAVAADASPPAAWPEGLVTRTPEMPIGLEGSMLELNKSLSEGLQPEDNAAVLLVQLFGPSCFDSELRIGSLDMLGIRSVGKTPRFQYIDAYVRAQGVQADADVQTQSDELDAALNSAIDRPWSSEQFPRFAEYLEANKAALDLVLVAADRPRYYAPLLSLEQPMRLISASYSIEHRLPFLARCLTARALLRCSQQDYDAAWTDLMACHKLAALVIAGSPLDNSAAKAHVVDAMASHAELGIVISGKLPGTQAEALLQRLAKLPPLPTAEDAANRGERAVIHEELELLRNDEESRKGFFETGTPEDLEQLKQILNTENYFQIALQTADAQQDKMVKLLSTRPRAELFEQIAISNEEFEKWNAGDADEEPKFAELATKDPESAARSIGEATAMALRTNPWQRRHTDERARMRHDIVTVGLALVAYRARHGEYPEDLGGIAPEIIAEVPVDVHSEKPFEYQRRTPGDVVLISLGSNQLNDAGAIFNDDLIVELH